MKSRMRKRLKIEEAFQKRNTVTLSGNETSMKAQCPLILVRIIKASSFIKIHTQKMCERIFQKFNAIIF